MNKKFIPIALLIALVVVALSAARFSSNISAPASEEPEGKVFVIEKGEGVNKISVELFEAGLIKSKFNFETYVWLKDLEGSLQAGEHYLNTGMNIKEITEALTWAIAQERTIQIIEGWRVEEIGEYLEKEGLTTQAEFLKAINSDSFSFVDYPILTDKPKGKNLEGYLFPDTYRIYKDATLEDIIGKMLDNFESKLTKELREEIKNQGKTVFDVLTLASIVEKEVLSYEDRTLAADVFYKRLEAGMPLQSDATVNYVTQKGTTRPSYEDINVSSRYNTYKYAGLPPGPISNPGLDSIRAVIYPNRNNYWYFLTTEEGETIFSRTGEEHVMNKARYLR